MARVEEKNNGVWSRRSASYRWQAPRFVPCRWRCRSGVRWHCAGGRLAVWQSGPAPTELQLPVQLVVGSKSGLARGVVSPRSWLPVFWRGIVQHICPKSLSWHRAHDA